MSMHSFFYNLTDCFKYIFLLYRVTIPMPYHSIKDVPFHENIHRSLSKLHWERSRRIQLYIWPAVLRQMNVFYVGNPKSGKTMAYVLAICSFLMEPDRYASLPSHFTGPKAVIVCKGTQKAEEVHSLFWNILDSVNRHLKLALGVPPLDSLCLVCSNLLLIFIV